ncbi:MULTISPECIES: acyl-CoA thioesterase [unclassified Knoellia]|uniref:acyl-CoA thioesterase n=1 Tax=Knoellia altitudinis TaxID=3404795 RepID=UPI00360BCC68
MSQVDPVPEVTARPYRTRVPLRWSDMDAYGHVNNVQYLRLLEDARVIGFREWFGTDRSLLDSGVIVSRHEIEYVAPLTYRPEPIEVDMWVTGVHGAGFNLGYAVRDPESLGKTVYAVAETGLVLYDFAASRPRRLTPQDREILAQHAGDSVAFRWSRR